MKNYIILMHKFLWANSQKDRPKFQTHKGFPNERQKQINNYANYNCMIF